MIKIDINKIEQWHVQNFARTIQGRYITLDDIEPLLKRLKTIEIGKSVLGKPIYKYTTGTGKVKVLIWSQMHGNESTGTKALFDMFNFFDNPKEFDDLTRQILERCQITFIPMLNPDGAEVYTRVNANEVDLNRDAVDLSQLESKLLRSVLDELQPEYCFNLHDQRTIFTVGDTKQTATLSFLAPSVNESREITESRKETMCVIVAMNRLLQQIIPGKIGRYTDEFYPTATGDNFQKLGHNTILIEAGHFKGDYEREEVRKFNFLALLQGLNYISSSIKKTNYNDYFDIPNNTEFYLDKIYTNILLEEEDRRVAIGIHFKEVLELNTVIFHDQPKYLDDISLYNADKIIDKSDVSYQNLTQLQRFLKKNVKNFAFI